MTNVFFITTFLHSYSHDNKNDWRITIPLEKKKSIAYNKNTFAILLLKKSATNFFVSFSFNGLVLFSCSSGGAGLKKKERRRRHAPSEIGQKFTKFVRYYYKTNKSVEPFRRVLVHMQAPISYFKLFIRSFRLYSRHLSKLYQNKSTGMNIRMSSKIKKLLSEYDVYNTQLRWCLKLLRFNKSKKSLSRSTAVSIWKCIQFFTRTYNCNVLSFFRSFFLSNNNNNTSYYNTFFSKFRLFDMFSFFSRQTKLCCSIISNPRKKIIISYLNKYLNIFYYFKHANNVISFDLNVNHGYGCRNMNYLFFSFLDNYSVIQNDSFYDYMKFFFISIDSKSTRYSEFRSKKLNSKIRNNICGRFRTYSLYKPDLSYVFFFIRADVTLLSSLIKYAYLDTSFYADSLDILKICLHKYILFSSSKNKKKMWKYKSYYTIFVKRFFTFFLHKYVRFFFSRNVYVFHRSLLNTVFSVLASFHIVFSQTDSFFNKTLICNVSLDRTFFTYNFWLFNSMCLFSFSESVSFVYYLWLREQIRYFYIHRSIVPVPTLLTKIGEIRGKIKWSYISDLFYITEKKLKTVPKWYITQMCNVASRAEAINLVTYWVRNNLLILPEWKQLFYSRSSNLCTNQVNNFIYKTKKLFSVITCLSYTFFTLSYSNVFLSQSNTYVLYFKHQSFSFFHLLFTSFLFFCRTFFLRRYLYNFFSAMLLHLNVCSYFFSKYKKQLFLFGELISSYRSIVTKRLNIEQIGDRLNNLCETRRYLRYSFKIVFFYDRGSFPYNGCRSRQIF